MNKLHLLDDYITLNHPFQETCKCLELLTIPPETITKTALLDGEEKKRQQVIYKTKPIC
jgi:hypothetical protein